MAFNPADKYVTPTGIGVYNNLFGENQVGGPQNFFGSGGGLFGSNPFESVKNAWDFQRLGYGIVPGTDQLNAASLLATNRWNNFPDQWNQWNATDVTGPDGEVLLSPVHMTGLRVSQDYGVDRDAQGNVADPWHSQMFQAGLGIRNNLNSDNWLDPNNQVAGLRGLNASSPYAMPNPNDYLSTMQRAQGGPGQADFYGQRGLTQTQNLDEVNQRQLTRGIDREAQMTLANQLPETMQAMEAAGLGRSGAGQLALMNNQNQILEQANRDKQRTMADYTNQAANRQSAAINLGSQIGAQGYENYAGRQGQAALAGMGDLFNANQTNRNNEQALFGQAMQNRFQKNQGDQNALFQLLGQSGQYTLGGLDAERMGQSQSLQDWMGLQAQRDSQRSSYMNDMLTLSERQRSIEQERINQMIQAGYLPLNLMQTITTGVQGNSGSNGGQTTPWWSGALNGAAQGAGEGVGGWFGSWMEKNA